MTNGVIHWFKFASPQSFYPLAGRMLRKVSGTSR